MSIRLIFNQSYKFELFYKNKKHTILCVWNGLGFSTSLNDVEVDSGLHASYTYYMFSVYV